MADFDADSFFAGYAIAFTALSADAVASHFALPVFMATGDERVAITEPADLRARVGALIERYRASGLAIARARILDGFAVEERFVTVSVHWNTADGEGEPLASFGVQYVVDLAGDRPAIVAVFNPSGQ